MEGGLSKMKIWVNGTFDVMHVGHIKLLEYANSLGIVRVGLDTDERIKEKKGFNRPINCLQDRIDFMESIKYVDSVVSFNSDKELEERIKEWDSELMVIGNDYIPTQIIGFQLFKEVLFFNKVDGKSTTKILSSFS
jgi:D-beta-D-heptose 7-phosphate kinase/D-beta-D-heptose 1-phosphate adenosyltransferase